MRDPIGDSVARIRDGGLVAYPTETVWGIGADATSPDAVARLFEWKGRPRDLYASLLVTGLADLEALEFEIGPMARMLTDAFWPGPLTLVMPCRRDFPPGIRNPNGCVGVRCPSHPLAAALARRCAAEGVGPITATSLNRSGESPAATRAEAVAMTRGDDAAPQLIAIEETEAGGDLESTVVDVCGDRPKVLRVGSIAEAELLPLFNAAVADGRDAT